MTTIENMVGILNILEVCIWMGVIIVCFVLVVWGVLQWLGNPSEMERKNRLTLASWIAFIVLVALISYKQRANIVNFFASEADGWKLNAIVLNGSTIIIKLLLLGAIFAVTAFVLLAIIFLIRKGVSEGLKAQDKITPSKAPEGEEKKIKDWATGFKKICNLFGCAIKTSGFSFFVTCGILFVFIMLPFFFGEIESKEGLAKIWGNRVQEIISTNKSIVEAIVIYLLGYIIVLGVGFALVRIIYAIVKGNLHRVQAKSLIDEYATPMGVLAVGVSILLAINDSESSDPLEEYILPFLKYFAIVAMVITLIIVMLEIIRLAMDMWEPLIRQEARCLFVALVGRSSLLILVLLNSIFSALNSAIGQRWDNEGIYHIQNKLIQSIEQNMEEAIGERIHDKNITFIIFRESITKK